MWPTVLLWNTIVSKSLWALNVSNYPSKSLLPLGKGQLVESGLKLELLPEVHSAASSVSQGSQGPKGLGMQSCDSVHPAHLSRVPESQTLLLLCFSSSSVSGTGHGEITDLWFKREHRETSKIPVNQMIRPSLCRDVVIEHVGQALCWGPASLWLSGGFPLRVRGHLLLRCLEIRYWILKLKEIILYNSSGSLREFTH